MADQDINFDKAEFVTFIYKALMEAEKGLMLQSVNVSDRGKALAHKI